MPEFDAYADLPRPTVPAGMTMDEYRRSRLAQARRRGLVANACGLWTRFRNPVRHVECSSLPLDQCQH